jgi:type II secretory pathway component PulF
MPSLQVKKRRWMDWSVFGFFLFVSGCDLFESLFIIPRFQEIYADMGTKATGSAWFVLQWRFLLVSLALVSLATGIAVVCRASTKAAMKSILALILVAAIQIGFTTVALFAPLTGVIIQATPTDK